jgi:hypothetical protein
VGLDLWEPILEEFVHVTPHENGLLVSCTGHYIIDDLLVSPLKIVEGWEVRVNCLAFVLIICKNFFRKALFIPLESGGLARTSNYRILDELRLELFKVVILIIFRLIRFHILTHCNG